MSAINVLKYIYFQNSKLAIIKHFTLAVLYQVFKRVSKNIISIQLFNGNSIFLFPDCNISSMLIYTEIPDKKEINFLRKYADKKTIFLDIGANIGSYSLLIADKCYSVLAFEPHPLSNARCKMNFMVNNINSENILSYALSDQDTTKYFTDLGGSSSVNKISDIKTDIEVETRKLDTLFFNGTLKLDWKYIIKIDVEGHEEEVIDGASIFLSSGLVKAMVIECFQGDDSKVIKKIKNSGFKVSKASENNYICTLRNEEINSNLPQIETP